MSVAKQIREPRADYLALEEPALLRGFELLATAEGGVAKLRELILTLALQGKLVPQSTKDEPASTILAKVRKEKAAIATTGKRKANASAPMNHGANAINVPAGWCASSLAEIGIISPRNTTDDDTLTSFVQMSAIPVGLMETHATEQRQWGEIKSGFTHFAEGDVGLAKITPCFENGKSTIFRNLENGIGAGTTELHIVRPLGNVLPEYILIFLKSPAFLKNGEAGMTGSAGQKRLPRAYFESTPFPLPPLAEQRRIVARVEELLTLCDELEARGRLADEQHARLTTALFDALTASDSAQTLADNWQRIATHFDLLLDRPQAIDALEQTILQLAVRGLLVPQDANDEPASKLLARIRAEKDRLIAESKIKRDKSLPPVKSEEMSFEVPDGWAWARMNHISDNRLGKMLDKAKNTGKLYPYLRNTNVQWQHIGLDDLKEIRLEDHEVDEYRLAVGDLLICEGGYPGRCAIWNEPRREMFFQKALHRVRPLCGVLAEYLEICMRTDSQSGALEQYFTGATIKHFAGQELNRYAIPLPPLAEQHRIVTRVEHLRRLCDNLRERLNKARAIQTHLAEALVMEAVQPQRGIRLG